MYLWMYVCTCIYYYGWMDDTTYINAFVFVGICIYVCMQAISLGRLKRNDIEDNADPCEMAAHYRLKYGLSGNDLTKSLPTLQHGQFNASSSLSTNVTSSAVPPIQELDSGSDSDGTVSLPSSQNPRRVKSYDEKKLSQSSGMLDVRRQVAKDQKKHSPKFRHSSFIPQSGSDTVGFTANKEISNSGYVNASVASRTLSSPSVQPSNQYHYVRNSVAVVEDITGVYGTSPKIQRHGYQNIKRPVDTQGNIMRTYVCMQSWVHAYNICTYSILVYVL